MKRKLSILLGTAVMLTSVSMSAAAAESDSPAVTAQQQSAAGNLVQARKVLNDLGAAIEWDHETKSAIIELEDLSIIIDAVEKSALYNGKQFFFEEGMLAFADGRLYVSAAFIETVFGGMLVEASGTYSIVKEKIEN